LGTCSHCVQEEEEEEEEEEEYDDDFLCNLTKSNLFCYQTLLKPLLATSIRGINSQTSPQKQGKIISFILPSV
jgi:hypothetical protein